MIINMPKRGRRINKWIPILSAWVLFAGCASPLKKACIETDWMRVGYEEGRQGHLAEKSASRRDSCITEGAPPDVKKYEQGRQKGIEAYCTAENGHTLGLKGEPYQVECPPNLKGAFVGAYQKGLSVYAPQLEGDIKTKMALQNKMRIELAGVEEEIAYLDKEIADANDGQARLRMGMISEMRMLDANHQSLSLQIGALEMDLNEMRQRLSRIREQIGSLQRK